jgi:hypothetical protein
MYECDPHSGSYRRYTDGEADAFEAWVAAGNPGDYSFPPETDPIWQGTFEHNGNTYQKSVFRGNGVYGPNKWQMFEMPIKASYCDAFYTACKNDYFCGDGDFWACSADYRENPTPGPVDDTCEWEDQATAAGWSPPCDRRKLGAVRNQRKLSLAPSAKAMLQGNDDDD